MENLSLTELAQQLYLGNPTGYYPEPSNNKLFRMLYNAYCRTEGISKTFSDLSAQMVDGTFNAFWRCKAKSLHPCLVPCSTSGVVLKNEDWERYSTLKAIEESPHDQLDKVSLRLHLRSGKKCRRILEDGIIADCFHKIDKKLTYAQADSEEDQDRSSNAIPFQTMRKNLIKVRDSICLETEKLNYTGDRGQQASHVKPVYVTAGRYGPDALVLLPEVPHGLE